MSQRTGTAGIAPFVIQDDAIPQPAAFADQLNKGWHTRNTIDDRNNIELHYRGWGMVCVVTNDGSNNGVYQLNRPSAGVADDDIEALMDNGNWLMFTGGSGNNTYISTEIGVDPESGKPGDLHFSFDGQNPIGLYRKGENNVWTSVWDFTHLTKSIYDGQTGSSIQANQNDVTINCFSGNKLSSLYMFQDFVQFAIYENNLQVSGLKIDNEGNLYLHKNGSYQKISFGLPDDMGAAEMPMQYNFMGAPVYRITLAYTSLLWEANIGPRLIFPLPNVAQIVNTSIRFKRDSNNIWSSGNILDDGSTIWFGHSGGWLQYNLTGNDFVGIAAFTIEYTKTI